MINNVIQAFVFGVMIEFTICHFAKNQEMIRKERGPNLIVDSALSTLFGAARDVDDLVSPVHFDV